MALENMIRASNGFKDHVLTPLLFAVFSQYFIKYVLMKLNYRATHLPFQATPSLYFVEGFFTEKEGWAEAKQRNYDN